MIKLYVKLLINNKKNGNPHGWSPNRCEMLSTTYVSPRLNITIVEKVHAPKCQNNVSRN